MNQTNQDGPRSRHSLLPLLGLAVLTIFALVIAWIDPSALCALPALVLPILRVLRRYPGEHVLAVLRSRIERRPRPDGDVPCVSRREIVAPRGGLLLARALAIRPPPSAQPAAT